jgi:hypothetical protein
VTPRTSSSKSRRRGACPARARECARAVDGRAHQLDALRQQVGCVQFCLPCLRLSSARRNHQIPNHSDLLTWAPSLSLSSIVARSATP